MSQALADHQRQSRPMKDIILKGVREIQGYESVDSSFKEDLKENLGDKLTKAKTLANRAGLSASGAATGLMYFYYYHNIFSNVIQHHVLEFLLYMTFQLSTFTEQRIHRHFLSVTLFDINL